MRKRRQQVISDSYAGQKEVKESVGSATELAQYYQQDELPRILNKPMSDQDGIDPIIPPQSAPGVLSQQPTQMQVDTPTETDQALVSVLKRAPKPAQSTQETVDTDYDGSGLMNKLLRLQGKAGSKGKELHLSGGMKSKLYEHRFLNILKMFAEATGMICEDGPRGLSAYWENEGIYTGIYCINRNVPNAVSLSIMSAENKHQEDYLKNIETYDDFSQFDTEAEDFLCLLYEKYLDS